MTIPVTIIGGYLGAGKTTLVNHLLRNANGLRLAVLVNEFGELPIDEDLIEAQDDTMISIAGGCVCCSFGNDLTQAMMDLTKLEPQPDHVLLEASGVALPGAIAASISLLQGFELDGTIVLADAETVRKQAVDTYVGDTIERQLLDADLVVLSKADLVSEQQLDEVSQWLKELNEGLEVIPASQGVLPPELLLQSFSHPRLDPARNDHSHHAHAAHRFSSASFNIEDRVDAERLAKRLASAELGLVRAKGFVIDTGGELKTVQVVARRWATASAPSNVRPSLVAIGSSEKFNKELVEAELQACVVKVQEA